MAIIQVIAEGALGLGGSSGEGEGVDLNVFRR